MIQSAAVLLLCGALVSGAAIPHVIESGRPGAAYPVWVDAETAFAPTGTIDTTLMSETSREMLEENRAKNGGQCREFLGRTRETPLPQTIDDLIEQSLHIFSGEVTAVRQGLYNGQPGTLAVVRLLDRFKRSGPPSAREVYVFIEQATIETPQGLVCSSTFSPSPAPQAGDHIIVFDDLNPMDESETLFAPDSGRGVVLERSGRVYLPDVAHATDAGRTMAEVLEFLRNHPLLRSGRGTSVR